MDTSHINTATLRSLLKLTEQRDALRGELKQIESAILGLASGRASAPVASPVAPTVKRKIRRRRKNRVATIKRAALKPAKAAKPAKATARKSSGKRGALKSRILSALRAAGAKGAAVKDLSKNLGVKPQNVHVWFSSTGKKLAEVQKIAPGRYRLKA